MRLIILAFGKNKTSRFCIFFFFLLILITALFLIRLACVIITKWKRFPIHGSILLTQDKCLFDRIKGSNFNW